MTGFTLIYRKSKKKKEFFFYKYSNVYNFISETERDTD